MIQVTGSIRILVLRNSFGGESVNTEPRVWAAVDKAELAIGPTMLFALSGALTCVNQSTKAMTYSLEVAQLP